MPRPKTDRSKFYRVLEVSFPHLNKAGEVITRKQVYSMIEAGQLTEADCRWLWNDADHETGQRGTYRVYAAGTTSTNSTTTKVPQETAGAPVDLSRFQIKSPTANAAPTMNAAFRSGTSSLDPSISLVPPANKQFIPFGCYEDVKEIIKSRLFFPVYITGLSGNGKTESVSQICAELGRELLRVNITAETDEFDLLGGMCLDQGSTVFHYGPVVEAMRRGAVLLLDEIDLGTAKIMCLQSILEGKGVYLKKVNQWIKPEPGFQILATANTKGQGHDSGKFHGTGLLNEAFLDRFPATIEQDYPSTPIERKILKGYMAAKGLTDKLDIEFAEILVDWAKNIRETFNANGGTGEVITTRRLITAITSYAIFNRNRPKAVSMACARFSTMDRDQFISLYDKLDETVSRARLEKEEAERLAEDKRLHPEKYATVGSAEDFQNNVTTDEVKNAREILDRLTSPIKKS